MRRFLLPAFLTAVVSAAAIVLLNVAVDPFGVWRPATTPLSLWVTRDASYARLAKAHWLRDRSPDLVLLGNSHAGAAFTAEQFQRHGLAQEPFNFSLVGASVSEMLANMRHAFFTTGARRFVVTVDLLNWRTRREEGEGAVTMARGEGLYQQLFHLRNFATTTFSLDATLRSLLFLRSGYIPTHRADGFALRCEDNPANWSRLLRSSRLRRNQFMEQRTQWLAGTAQQQAAFAEMLAFAREQDLQLLLVIPPFHVSYYYAMQAAGLWEQHLALLGHVVSEAHAPGNRERVRVVDFSLPGAFTLVTPDSPGTAGDEPLAWWINADHFDCALGERIVATLADASRGGFDSSTLSGDVGQVLTPAALVEYPQRVQRLLNAWQQQYPEAHRQLLQNTRLTGVSGETEP